MGSVAVLEKALEFLKQLMMRTNFEDLDLDDDGHISMDELKAGFRKAGVTGLSQAHYDDILSVVDTDGDGSIDVKELSTLSKNMKQIAELKARLAAHLPPPPTYTAPSAPDSAPAPAAASADPSCNIVWDADSGVSTLILSKIKFADHPELLVQYLQSTPGTTTPPHTAPFHSSRHPARPPAVP